MTRRKDIIDPREMANKIFDAGCSQKEIAHALDQIDECRELFLSQLALRTAMMYSENIHDDDLSSFTIPNSLLNDIKNGFEDIMTSHSGSIEPPSLSSPSTWLKAQEALGGDINLVMKLADGHLRPPRLRKAMRDLADALGVTMEQVRSHFEGGQVHGLEADEFSSRKKPTSHEIESFEDAVRGAEIPDALRRRWIGE